MGCRRNKRHPVAELEFFQANGGIVKMFNQSLTVGDDPYNVRPPRYVCWFRFAPGTIVICIP